MKISGDGAKMSRIANFIVLSFALLSDGEKVMSSKGKYWFNVRECKDHKRKIYIIICIYKYMHVSHR